MNELKEKIQYFKDILADINSISFEELEIIFDNIRDIRADIDSYFYRELTDEFNEKMKDFPGYTEFEVYADANQPAIEFTLPDIYLHVDLKDDGTIEHCYIYDENYADDKENNFKTLFIEIEHRLDNDYEFIKFTVDCLRDIHSDYKQICELVYGFNENIFNQKAKKSVCRMFLDMLKRQKRLREQIIDNNADYVRICVFDKTLNLPDKPTMFYRNAPCLICPDMDGVFCRANRKPPAWDKITRPYYREKWVKVNAIRDDRKEYIFKFV